MNSMPIRLIREGGSELRDRIAKACGITRQAVEQWKEVPPKRVRTVAKLLGLPDQDVYPGYLKSNSKKPVRRNGAAKR